MEKKLTARSRSKNLRDHFLSFLSVNGGVAPKKKPTELSLKISSVWYTHDACPIERVLIKVFVGKEITPEKLKQIAKSLVDVMRVHYNASISDEKSMDIVSKTMGYSNYAEAVSKTVRTFKGHDGLPTKAERRKKSQAILSKSVIPVVNRRDDFLLQYYGS